MTQKSVQNPGKKNYYLIGALLISLSIAAFVQRHALLNPLAVNDDVRNQIYWMAHLVDPNLFPNDVIANYFTQSSLISPLVWLVYWLASHGLDPVRVSQFLPLFLAPLATFFVYRFGESYAGKRYGFLAAFCFNLIIWISHNLAGGLARAFAYPMLFAFLFFLSRNNRIGLVLTTWMASLIYPPILFLSLGIWLVSFYSTTPKTETTEGDPTTLPSQPQPDKGSFLLGLGGSVAILAYRFLLAPESRNFGALANSTAAAQTPEFYEGGRVPIFHFFRQPIEHLVPFEIFSGLTSLFSEILARTPGINRTIPLLGIFLTYWLFQKFLAPKIGKLTVPPITWRLFWTAIGLYALAWVALFYLYVPERYLQLSIPVLYTFLLAGLLDVIIKLISKIKSGPKLKALLWACPLLLSGLIFSFVWEEDVVVPQPETMAVCNALKHTPKNTLIATTPGLASDIPLYARRSVLVSQEAYIPFHPTYFQAMKTRLKDFLQAYYAVDPAQLTQFINKYHVDYILVNTLDFSAQRTEKLHQKYYHSFSRDFYHRLTDGRTTQDFLLSHPRPSCRAVESGDYILIPSQAILAGKCWETNQSPSVSNPAPVLSWKK